MFKALFNNVGEKIKKFAFVFLVVLLLGSVIGAFALVASDTNYFLLSIGIILAGCLIAFLVAFLLYGFGEIVTNTALIVKKAQNNVFVNENKAGGSQANGVLDDLPEL